MAVCTRTLTSRLWWIFVPSLMPHSLCLGFFLPAVILILQETFKVLNYNILFRVLKESRNRRRNVAFAISSISKLPNLALTKLNWFSFFWGCCFALPDISHPCVCCHCLESASLLLSFALHLPQSLSLSSDRLPLLCLHFHLIFIFRIPSFLCYSAQLFS